MRMCVLLLLASAGGVSQSRGLDLEAVAGIPITETLRTYQTGGRFGGFLSESATRRYVAGGTVGARLSARLALQSGLLYRRFGYDYETWGPYPVPLTFTHFRGTGASWEVPVQVKWSLTRRPSFAPYAALGATFRRLAGMHEIQTQYNNLSLTNPQPAGESVSDRPQLLKSRNAIAPTVAAGLEFRHRRLVFGPEIRYTRWHQDTLGGFLDPIRWNWQQVDLLFRMGFTVGRK